METLRVNNVSKQFTGHRALHNVSISVPEVASSGCSALMGQAKPR